MGEVETIAKLPRRVRASIRQETEDADAASQGRMEPTPERRQHGSLIEQSVVGTDEEAARAGARVRCVQSPIERYFSRGQLTERQHDAAEDLRQDWEIGIIGVRKTMAGWVKVSGSMKAEYTEYQLNAAALYREAVQALGKRVSGTVLPVVIGRSDGGEITLDELARGRSDMNRHMLMGVLRTGLDMLADHYETCSDKRRAAKYG